MIAITTLVVHSVHPICFLMCNLVYKDPERFTYLTDSILKEIERSRDPLLKDAQRVSVNESVATITIIMIRLITIVTM